jgi:O-antigen/teichoic acid export membrane protein
VLVGLAGRSAVDKVLTLRGGPELVAYWAQLGSLIDLIAGVALAGVGTGVSVLVAQTDRPDRQRGLLRDALRLGLVVSAPAMLAVWSWSFLVPEALGGGAFSKPLIVIVAAVGCIAVVPGMLNGYWLGQQRRDLMLALAVTLAVLPLIAALAAPREHVLASIATAQVVPALAAILVMASGPAWVAPPEREHDRKALRRYVAPGLVIGVLTPLSMVAARGIVSGEMSWHEAGLLQSLWRVSDWVASLAGGVMAVHFLPRLSAAYRTPRFAGELRRAALVTVLPAGLALAVLFFLQRPLFALLYDESFRMSDATVALFFAGSLLRIASWLPLYALYAMRRTAPIMVGEFLSLPLFAALLAVFRGVLTLELAGALWLAAYCVYGLFNLWAVRRNA